MYKVSLMYVCFHSHVNSLAVLSHHLLTQVDVFMLIVNANVRMLDIVFPR